VCVYEAKKHDPIEVGGAHDIYGPR
jgi:hypothetical protein